MQMQRMGPARTGEGWEYWTTFLTDAPPMVWVSAWSPGLEALLAETGVERVAFRAPFFAGGGTLDFLRGFASQVRDVSVEGPALGASDAAVLADLPRLEALSLPGEVKPVDFSRLSALRRCVLEGGKTVGNVARAPALEDLGVFRAGLPDLRALEGAPRLRTLFVAEWSRLASLDGLQGSAIEELEVRAVPRLVHAGAVAGMPALRRLVLQGCRRVEDLEAVGRVGTLELLRVVDGPPVDSLEWIAGADSLASLAWASPVAEGCSLAPLARLPRLRALRLLRDARRFADLHRVGEIASLAELALVGAGTLPSLGFLGGLRNLERLSLTRAQVRDGDLGVLLELPRLREAVLQPAKPHYRPTPEQVQAGLRARPG
jgi:hypothetical protein